MRTLRRFSLIVLTGCLVALPAPTQSKKELTNAAEAAWEDQSWDKAAEAYAKLVKVDPENGLAWHHLGYALHALGRLDEALDAHIKAAELPGTGKATATYNIACVYALQKENDKAIEWLKKAAKAGFSNTDHMSLDPDMDNIREDPRYEKIVAAMESAEAMPAAQEAYVITTERASARLAYFGNNSSAGQLAISYGQPEWKDSYRDVLESGEFTNKRWRLGKDFWTTLDTNVPISVAGKKIAPGQYYMTIEYKGDDEFVLAFLDPNEVRSQKLDGFVAHYSKGGIEVPMKHGTSDEIAEKLSIEVVVGKENNTEGKLAIRFGPHTLTAPVTVYLTKSKAVEAGYEGEKKKKKTKY